MAAQSRGELRSGNQPIRLKCFNFRTIVDNIAMGK